MIVEQHGRALSDRLNQSLDELGAPLSSRERSTILGKMLHIPRQQAWSILEGHLVPDNDVLQKIAAELDVDTSLFKR